MVSDLDILSSMTSDSHGRLILEGARLATGVASDVHIAAGRIAQVCATGTGPPPGAAERLDLRGYLLLPAPVEPHAHLDKALLGSRFVNRSEDLDGAITAIRTAYESMTAADTSARALAAVRQAVAHGYTAIRTHVDCQQPVGTRNVRVLAQLRDQLADRIDIQIVALAGPVAGHGGAQNRRLLEQSLAAGADLVGGVPTLESDSQASVRELFAVAHVNGAGVDLHVDETLDAEARVLRTMARRVLATDFQQPVTASHCVSLSMQSEAEVRATADLVAAAGIGVVALPQTNLYLQGRGTTGNVPRGIAPIDLLRQAGVVVAGGSDNWRDPFNPMGRIDPLETASLLVTAAHQRIAEAYASITEHARRILRLDPVEIAPGGAASLLAIRAESLADAIGAAGMDRVVLHRGVVIARSQVRTEMHEVFGPVPDRPKTDPPKTDRTSTSGTSRRG